ncbi:MAG: pyridoxal phosphate-dependent aminotransferase [Anaerolineales bacterium]
MSIRVEPSVHGALDYAELEGLGIHPNDVLDFSVNSNPFGPSPRVWEAIRSTPLERYPDRESTALRREISKQLDIPPEHIMLGNGTAELIQLAAFAFLQKGDHALIVDPTFGEYERSTRLMGANIHRWRAVPEKRFMPQPAEIQKKLSEHEMRLVFICNPNNPTGQVLPLEILNEWSHIYPGTLFVVDEAYQSFAQDIGSAVSLRGKNILVLRSMTKDHAIAGLRLGYAVGDRTVIAALINLRSAWNVNALAQAAGLAALQDKKHLSGTLAKLREEKEVLILGLKELGYDPIPSRTNYFILPVENGAQFRQKLLGRGMLVRDCASFGLPAHVRIATRKAGENRRLLNAIREMYS